MNEILLFFMLTLIIGCQIIQIIRNEKKKTRRQLRTRTFMAPLRTEIAKVCKSIEEECRTKKWNKNPKARNNGKWKTK